MGLARAGEVQAFRADTSSLGSKHQWCPVHPRLSAAHSSLHQHLCGVDYMQSRDGRHMEEGGPGSLGPTQGAAFVPDAGRGSLSSSICLSFERETPNPCLLISTVLGLPL